MPTQHLHTEFPKQQGGESNTASMLLEGMLCCSRYLVLGTLQVRDTFVTDMLLVRLLNSSYWETFAFSLCNLMAVFTLETIPQYRQKAILCVHAKVWVCAGVEKCL